MADEVNKYAFEGGDTAPGTREQIHERNKAAEELAQAQREAGQAALEAREEFEQKMWDLEQNAPGSILTGDPVPPSQEPAVVQESNRQRESGSEEETASASSRRSKSSE